MKCEQSSLPGKLLKAVFDLSSQIPRDPELLQRVLERQLQKASHWPGFSSAYAHHVEFPLRQEISYRIHKSYLKTTDLKHILH